jgi:hypothetical protein
MADCLGGQRGPAPASGAEVRSAPPLFLAKAILERMRLTKWRINKEPPDPPHSTPGE